MKLAEALINRKQLKDKIKTIENNLLQEIRVPEDENVEAEVNESMTVLNNTYFELEDIVGNKGVSRPTQITADTTPPSINNPEDFYSNDSRYIYFNISIIEENLDEVTLSYEYERNGKLYEKEKRLCSRLKDGICEKKFRYQNYYESFQLNVFDKADNLIGIPVVLN